MKKQKTNWKANQDKAEAMTKKFIAALKKLDCFEDYATILMTGICNQLVEDKDDLKTEDIADKIEYIFGIRTIHSDNIMTDTIIDEFIEKIKENPYQLKLVS